MERYATALFFLGLLNLLIGCSSQERKADLAKAEQIATSGGMTHLETTAPPFVFTAYARLASPGQPLSIFIEGDGYAWRTPSQPSPNPTPDNPLALGLAAKTAALNPNANVLYLARPCQYTEPAKNPACKIAYWTNQRYAEEIVAATNNAINNLVASNATKGIHLLGYSGGAGLAALVAVRRNDVLSFRSVAGNLDPATLNAFHGVSPLSGSLDPIQTASALAHIPQQHWIGSTDKVVPPSVAESWAKHSEAAKCLKIESVNGASHIQGWLSFWTTRFMNRPTEALGAADFLADIKQERGES